MKLTPPPPQPPKGDSKKLDAYIRLAAMTLFNLLPPLVSQELGIRLVVAAATAAK